MTDNVDIPTLYHSKTSVCSQKVRLVLAELDIPWRGNVLDLKKGEQFTDDYRSLNPKASVPTYIDNQVCLTESNDIIVYLIEGAVNGTHLSLSPHVDDAVREWLTESTRFHSAVHVLTTLALNRAKLRNLSGEELIAKLDRIPDRARAERIHDVVQNGLSGIAASSAIIYLKNIFHKLNTRLERNEFLWGDALTLADFAILPFVIRIGFLQLTPNWSGVEFRSLDHWVRKLQERSSFDAAIMRYHSPEVVEKYQIAGNKVRKELINL